MMTPAIKNDDDNNNIKINDGNDNIKWLWDTKSNEGSTFKLNWLSFINFRMIGNNKLVGLNRKGDFKTLETVFQEQEQTMPKRKKNGILVQFYFYHRY